VGWGQLSPAFAIHAGNRRGGVAVKINFFGTLSRDADQIDFLAGGAGWGGDEAFFFGGAGEVQVELKFFAAELLDLLDGFVDAALRGLHLLNGVAKLLLQWN
jgi:hypothetical protein